MTDAVRTVAVVAYIACTGGLFLAMLGLLAYMIRGMRR